MSTLLCSVPQVDWKSDAEHWIEETLQQLGYSQVGKPAVVEDWFLGDVWRIATDKGDVYFKATALLPLFSNEAQVCDCLSDLFKENVPTVLAYEKERCWLLTCDFGEPLDESVDLTVWSDAYQRWGALQRVSVDHVDKLGQSGCQSRAISTLLEQLHWYLEQPTIASLLSSNGKRWERRLSEKLEVAIEQLTEFALPDCLVHGDLHEGNMAKNANSYLFFDWSDACISHPFMEGNFIYQFSETSLKQQLIKRYLSNWQHCLSEQELLQAWDMAQPVCYAHHAVTYASIVLNSQHGKKEDIADFESSLIKYVSCLIDSL
ncbi:aminoglycoside phosphotransferase family protein [Vibrio sp. Of7-15]|uniref:aminoglycoside phosphotransferase family protein n=1 Tax=Vibrio sp. Of7-15 TaxID=2724879 RepID=UPI001EF3AA4E|nr:aminoglycoside phosphotransferase family protein [Vibrio sp. Of7-15]MCG7499713.1 aminoglycoside phosphotransferase family protein [Vibrio sp. Of7-15]